GYSTRNLFPQQTASPVSSTAHAIRDPEPKRLTRGRSRTTGSAGDAVDPSRYTAGPQQCTFPCASRAHVRTSAVASSIPATRLGSPLHETSAPSCPLSFAPQHATFPVLMRAQNIRRSGEEVRASAHGVDAHVTESRCKGGGGCGTSGALPSVAGGDG